VVRMLFSKKYSGHRFSMHFVDVIVLHHMFDDMTSLLDCQESISRNKFVE
jgi:hypothetical protein